MRRRFTFVGALATIALAAAALLLPLAATTAGFAASASPEAAAASTTPCPGGLGYTCYITRPQVVTVPVPSTTQVTQCGFQPGTTVTITVNGQPYLTLTVPASGCVTLTISTRANPLSLSINGGPWVAARCGANSVVVTGTSAEQRYTQQLIWDLTVIVGNPSSATCLTAASTPATPAGPASAATSGLALTGADLGLMAGGAAVLLAVGLLLVVLARRRRHAISDN